MTNVAIPLRSNPGIVKNQGSAKIINCYAEQGGGDQKSPVALVACAGQKRFSSTTSSPCRGMIYIEEAESDTGRIYSANGFGLWSIEEDGTKTNIQLISGNTSVFFARNDVLAVDCIMVSDNKAYVIKNNAATYKSYDFTPSGVTFCGGYFVYWVADGANKGRFYASGLSSTEVDPLSFATAEGDPDGLTKAHGSINTLYLIGKRTTEIWSINGGADFPFSKSGAHLRFGSDSPQSVQDFNNGVAWVGNDNLVYFVSGYDYTTLTKAPDGETHEITRLIEAEADKSSIVAFTYQRSGNKFYCLQGTGWTREYNAASGNWHDRRTGPFNQWDSIYAVKAWGRDIFGSRTTGQFSENDTTLGTENDGVQVWGFDTALLHAHPKGLQFDSIDFNMETGVGNASTVDPLMMLAWSDDGGRTYTSERHLKLGKRGNSNLRTRAQRLGKTGNKGRSYRVRVSDPVVRSISLMDIEASAVDL